MSQLDTLSIKGIRSFDPSSKSKITFFSPVTLIVGHNGAGKTTIIESLLYITTGEAPPNSKRGIAFVHDPKLHGTSTQAEVALMFKSMSGSNIYISRSMRSDYSHGATKFQTMDRTLKILSNEDGNFENTTHSEAELQTVMPGLIGVSKSIMQNVILCHQEDSMWPLSESKDLKDKFAEIFETSKWTKACDTVKELKKNAVAKMEVYTQDLAFQIERVNNAEGNLRQQKRLKREICYISDEIQNFAAECRELNEILDQFDEKERILGQISAAESRISELKEINIIEDLTKEELLLEIDSVRKKMETSIFTSSISMSEIDNLKEKLKKLEDDYMLLFKEKTIAEQKFDLFVKTISELYLIITNIKEHRTTINDTDEFTNMLSKVKVIHYIGLESYDEKYKFESVQRENIPFLNSIWEVLEKRHNQLLNSRENITFNKSENASKLSNELEKIKTDITGLKSNKNMYSNELSNHLDIVRNKEKDVSLMKSAGIPISDCLKEIKAKKISLKKEYSSKIDLVKLELLKYKEEYPKLKADISEKINFISRSLEKIDDEQQILSNLSDLRAELKHKQKIVDEARFEIISSLSNCKLILENSSVLLFEMSIDLSSKVDCILSGINGIGNDFNIEDINSIAESIKCFLPMLYDAIKNAELDFKEYELKNSALGAALKKKSDSIMKIRAQIDCLTNSVATFINHLDQKLTANLDCSTISIESFNSMVNPYEIKGERYMSELERWKSLNKIYTGFLQESVNKEMCPLCERKFLENGHHDFNSILNKKMHDIPKHIESCEKDKMKNDIIISQIAKARMELEERGKLQESLSVVEAEFNGTRAELDKLESNVNLIRPVKDNVASFEETLRKIESLYNQIYDKCILLKKVESSLLNLNDSIDKKVPGGKSVESLNEERKSLYKLKEELDLSNLNIESKLKSYQDELYQLSVNTQEISLYLKSIMIDEISTDLANMSIHLQEKLSEIDSHNKLFETKLKCISDRILLFENEYFLKFKNVLLDIKSYTDSGSLNSLMEILKIMISTKSQLDSYKHQLESLEISRHKDSENTSNLKSRLSSLQQSSRCLELSDDILKWKKELEILEYQLTGKNIVSVRENKLELESKHYSKQGEIKEKSKTLDMLQIEYESKWKTVFNDKQKALVLTKTQEILINDLDKYIKAIEKGINKFHTIIMEDINATMDELWQRTYRGNDIETIRIVADDVGTKVNVSRYSYRIVMVKKGTEIDMRGRCSAGQKVLTCLIVRLALAERFALKCGFLALDEPTTNLDEENIESLASALSELIISKKEKSQFQLIIITHDEHFKEMLMREGLIASYYRITKNIAGYSTITHTV